MTKRIEQGRISVHVKSINIHDNWNPSDGFEGDIALLKIDSVQINRFVRPVCIASSLISSISDGTVIGWGHYDDSATTSEVPRKIEVPILSTMQCLKRNNALVNIITESMFCAGMQGAGVCAGDSGSGFYIEHDNVFYLRGIVSSSIITRCNETRGIVLYSDILNYLDFFHVVIIRFLIKCL